LLHLDRARFDAAFATLFPKPKRTPEAAAGLATLLSAIEQDSDVDDIRWVAYMLATIKHECANRWIPVVEYGPRSYFDKYETGTAIGARLGNTQPGDGFRFRGRGFVQITGRRNYLVLGQKLNLGTRLVDEPELALDSAIAYRVMSLGMRNGSFTGRKLAQFIGPGQCDYRNARKIINGLDKADLIAEYARALEQVLVEARKTSVADAPIPAVAAPVVAALAPSPPPPVEPVAPVRTVMEQGVKGFFRDWLHAAGWA
jgi:putative chitinase